MADTSSSSTSVNITDRDNTTINLTDNVGQDGQIETNETQKQNQDTNNQWREIDELMNNDFNSYRDLREKAVELRKKKEWNPEKLKEMVNNKSEQLKKELKDQGHSEEQIEEKVQQRVDNFNRNLLRGLVDVMSSDVRKNIQQNNLVDGMSSTELNNAVYETGVTKNRFQPDSYQGGEKVVDSGNITVSQQKGSNNEPKMSISNKATENECRRAVDHSIDKLGKTELNPNNVTASQAKSIMERAYERGVPCSIQNVKSREQAKETPSRSKAMMKRLGKVAARATIVGAIALPIGSLAFKGIRKAYDWKQMNDLDNLRSMHDSMKQAYTASKSASQFHAQTFNNAAKHQNKTVSSLGKIQQETVKQWDEMKRSDVLHESAQNVSTKQQEFNQKFSSADSLQTNDESLKEKFDEFMQDQTNTQLAQELHDKSSKRLQQVQKEFDQVEKGSDAEQKLKQENEQLRYLTTEYPQALKNLDDGIEKIKENSGQKEWQRIEDRAKEATQDNEAKDTLSKALDSHDKQHEIESEMKEGATTQVTHDEEETKTPNESNNTPSPGHQ